MSVEDDIELRDLVTQTLESNGCLAKIRAQLRASIFLALDEDVKISQQQPLLNNKVKTHLETEEGKLMFCVVREFLDFFNLYFTLSVFDPETCMGNGYKYEGREQVANYLGVDNTDTSFPLLMQLIKIAQTKSKSLEINLNLHRSDVEEMNLLTQENSCKKTDFDMSSDEINVNLECDKLLIENCTSTSQKMNATFDLSSPTVNFNLANRTDYVKTSASQKENSKLLDNVDSKKDEKDDDTYGDTSSIPDDSMTANLANAESNITVPELISNGIEEFVTSESINEDISPPVVKELKTLDKTKLSPQKSEKFKSKSSLSTLSDLPPLQISKPRVNDILPSLYSKEFKDKSNLRELDKLFDMDAEYEEDFICSGDDLSLKSDYNITDHSKSNLLDDFQASLKTASSDKSDSNKKDMKQKISHKVISDPNKQLCKSLEFSLKTKEPANSLQEYANKTVSYGVSSTNENFDVNNSD